MTCAPCSACSSCTASGQSPRWHLRAPSACALYMFQHPLSGDSAPVGVACPADGCIAALRVAVLLTLHLPGQRGLQQGGNVLHAAGGDNPRQVQGRTVSYSDGQHPCRPPA